MKFVAKNNKYVQGIFKPVHSEKYKGHDLPRYLSSWELKLFRWCDMNPNIVEWGSESVIVPYTHPVDHKTHNYIVDAVIKLKTPQGVKKYLVEVKPKKQTQVPQNAPGKHQKTLLHEQLTYIVNQAKWLAAEKWAKSRGYTFVVITEQELQK